MGVADVTAIVGTYGDQSWADLALARAVPSLEAQTLRPEFVVHSHAETLAGARNGPGMHAVTEWLLFVDADDEVNPTYVEAMMAAVGDLRTPAVQYILDGVEAQPRWLRPRDLMVGNYLVIGTMMRTEHFQRVGGFGEWPAYEDWDLFIRLMEHCGAVVGRAPGALYRAHSTAHGRNSQDPAVLRYAYDAIRLDNFGIGAP